MASDNHTLIIAYSGSLDAKRNLNGNSRFQSIKQWFWTYKHNTVDASTRSAYYLIKALAILKKKYQLHPGQLQVHLWGSIDKLNAVHAEENGVSEFFFISSYLPKAESLQKLSDADLLFLPLEKSNVKGKGTLFIPGKLYEYLHIGKPILALCENSDCKSIIDSSGLGIVVSPDKPDEIAEALWKIVQDRTVLSAKTPNKEYISGFSFRSKTAELAKIFDSFKVH